MSKRPPIRVMLVEDSPFDALIVEELLAEWNGRFVLERYCDLGSVLASSRSCEADLILLDLSLPDSDGVESFITIQRCCPQLPVVIMSGQDEESLAIELVQRGAQDYLPKSQIGAERLGHAILFSLQRSALARAVAAERELHDWSRLVERAREEERGRIANELHDELGSHLSALKMDLHGFGKDIERGDHVALGRRVQEMGQLIDGMVASTRRLCTELRPAIIDDLGLAAALEWLVENFQHHSGIVCRLHLPAVEIEPDSASSEISLALFRVLQESLTNVMRHAGASRVEITLQCPAGQLILQVEDDGRGLDLESGAPDIHFGMRGMRRRLQAVAGSLQVEPSRTGGVLLIAKVPLPP